MDVEIRYRESLVEASGEVSQGPLRETLLEQKETFVTLRNETSHKHFGSYDFTPMCEMFHYRST